MHMGCMCCPKTYKPHAILSITHTQALVRDPSASYVDLIAAFQEVLDLQELLSTSSDATTKPPELDEHMLKLVCQATDRLVTTPTPTDAEADLARLLLRQVINHHARLFCVVKWTYYYCCTCLFVYHAVNMHPHASTPNTHTQCTHPACVADHLAHARPHAPCCITSAVVTGAAVQAPVQLV